MESLVIKILTFSKIRKYLYVFTLGNPANSTWVVRKLGLTKSGGPYQFSHIYQRCNNHAAQCADVLNPASEPFCSFTEGCCSDLETGLKCQPECEIGIGEENRLRDDQESAILPDVGLYWHFETDSETGEPFGCPGMEVGNWKNGKIIKNIFKVLVKIFLNFRGKKHLS